MDCFACTTLQVSQLCAKTVSYPGLTVGYVDLPTIAPTKRCLKRTDTFYSPQQQVYQQFSWQPFARSCLSR